MSEPEDPQPSTEAVANKKIDDPELGMSFETDEEAFQFYRNYAWKIGFIIRKQNVNYTAAGLVRTRKFVCQKEGVSRSKHKDRQANRLDAKTGCLAHMDIKRTTNGAFYICGFETKHNHPLISPYEVPLLKSRRIRTLSQIASAKLADVSAKRLKATCHRLDIIPAVCENYLQSKRKISMKPGDAGAMMQYLQGKQVENPGFYYAVQLDEDDQITNIFWADARCMLDYEHFGDVVCFDTTYRTNEFGRPFAPFLGVNHHKQTIFFGAAFLYDETLESFKWLFETFKHVMNGKQPQVILTDQDTAMADAVVAAWPGTIHRLCVWHMYQNATKHLMHIFQSSKTFRHDLSECMYDYEDEEDFSSAWQEMLKKYNLTNNVWFSKLFEDRGKWALPFGRKTFCADMKSTQRTECLNRVIKNYLNLGHDLTSFFKHYETLVEDRRYKEFEADFRASQITQTPHSMLLKQAAAAYTASVYEVFQKEYDLFVDCTIHCCGEVGAACDYKVTNEATGKTSFVRFYSLDDTATCSCKRFEFVGVQCCHVLKVLDYRNVKQLPQQYFLKRWRKDAKVGILRDRRTFLTSSDPKIALPNRYNSLGRIYNQILARASESEDAYQIAVTESIRLMEKVEQALQKRGDRSQGQVASEPSIAPSSDRSQVLVVSKDPIIASHDRYQDLVMIRPPITPYCQQSQIAIGAVGECQHNNGDGIVEGQYYKRQMV